VFLGRDRHGRWQDLATQIRTAGTPHLLADYELSVGAAAKALKSYWGKEVSDPVKVAQVVLRLAASVVRHSE
jgi:hypothetical protein